MVNLLQNEYTKAYDEFADAIFRYCYLRVSSREKAKDIMQDTFMKVWEYINKNDAEILNVRAFLYKTANNLIIDDYRKKKSVSLDELHEKGFEPASGGHQDIQNNAELAQAMKFISKLEPKKAELIIMRYVDDMSPREIAKIVGGTENSVSVSINRAMKKVKEIIKHVQ